MGTGLGWTEGDQDPAHDQKSLQLSIQILLQTVQWDQQKKTDEKGLEFAWGENSAKIIWKRRVDRKTEEKNGKIVWGEELALNFWRSYFDRFNEGL